MSVHVIAVTGGPCGGKSGAAAPIRAFFSAKGYTVLTIAETATELIDGGISPKTCPTPLAYQTLQMDLQLEKERVVTEAAGVIGAKETLIVCDRGAVDCQAYLSDADYEALLARFELTHAALLARYDAVFHMVSTAVDAPRAYTLANNSARTETPEEAAALDAQVREAWRGHPYVRLIDNATDFDGKLARLLDAIWAFLQACDSP